MFLLRRPTADQIGAFLLASRGLPLSYEPVGVARGGARGFRRDAVSVTIGKGDADFRKAIGALRAWRQFPPGWTRIVPEGAPVTVGTDVAVLISHLGFWSLNGARVVYESAAEGALAWGYAYGTLTNHAESGEEIFEVRLDDRTGVVTYHLSAVSRPRALLARAGYPITRALQARFRRDSARAMRAAVSSQARMRGATINREGT